MSLDVNKLNSFSQEFYHKFIARHPGWAKRATNDEVMGEEFLVIRIPAQITDSFNIDICTYQGEENEITVHFGPAHIHMFMYRLFRIKTIDNQIEAVEEIIEKIFNEELISIQLQPGLLGTMACGMVNKAKYLKLLDKGKLRKAVSWNKTYNYPDDGTHLDWE